MIREAAVVIGDSPGILGVVKVAARVASTTASVLIQGEPGTGKELLARFLHERSRRRAGPFVSVKAASVASDAFEVASGGTLFLDEVDGMSATTQAAIARAIEERAVDDVRRGRRAPVDVRLIAGTDRDLDDDVSTGRFRPDLYYRLAVVVLRLPPLRERGDDVRMLAEHFVGSVAWKEGRFAFALATETLTVLQTHPWPGNVRQLKEALEHAASAARGPVLRPRDLPAHTFPPDLTLLRQAGQDDFMTLDELERRHIMRVLAATGAHTGRAADVLGIPLMVLRHKLQEYDLRRIDFVDRR